MRAGLSIALITVWAGACSGGNPSTGGQAHAPDERADSGPVPVVATPPVVAPAAATTPDAAPASTAPALTGSLDFVVGTGEPYRHESGLVFQILDGLQDFGGNGYDQVLDSIFVLTAGGKTEEAVYSYSTKDLAWYAEGQLLGYVFTAAPASDPRGTRAPGSPAGAADGDRRRVTLTPTDAPPIERDEAHAIGRRIGDEESEWRGCRGKLTSVMLASPGTVEYGRFADDRSGCTMLIGVYTQQVIAYEKLKPQKGKAPGK